MTYWGEQTCDNIVKSTQKQCINQAYYIKDNKLLKVARDSANQILKKDPNLEKSENQIIKRTLSSINVESNIWNFIS